MRLLTFWSICGYASSVMSKHNDPKVFIMVIYHNKHLKLVHTLLNHFVLGMGTAAILLLNDFSLYSPIYLYTSDVTHWYIYYLYCKNSKTTQVLYANTTKHSTRSGICMLKTNIGRMRLFAICTIYK